MRWKNKLSTLMALILVSGTLAQPGFAIDVKAENEAATVEAGTTEAGPSTEEDATTESEEDKNDKEATTESKPAEEAEKKEETTEKESSEKDSTEAPKPDKTVRKKDTKHTSEDKEDEEDKDTKKSKTDDNKEDDQKNQKEEKPEVTGTEVVKDDSDGRDYAESEIVSSGNTTFKIVTVTKNKDIIDINIRNLRKRRDKIKAELKSLQVAVDEEKKIISDIEGIYKMIQEHNPDVTKKDMYLIGYRKSDSTFKKLDSIAEMDNSLRSLALKSHNDDLIQWTEEFSTEQVPNSLMEDSKKDKEEAQENEKKEEIQMTSSADGILQNMLEAAYKNIDEQQPKIKKLEKKLNKIKKRIIKQKEDKKNNTIDIDSRLVAYKEKIPNQAATFLNEVVEKEGTPYVWGADGPNSFDCSGLVSYGLRQCGAVESGFRWTSQDFRNQIKQVSFEEALPGDLVWKSGHIAIYIDENTVFEAPYTGAHIRFTSCNVSSRFTSVLRWWSAE